MATRSSLHPNELPDEFFAAVAFLIPYLNRVAQAECGISIGGLLVLFHLTHSGKMVADRPTMLRRELSLLLEKRGFSQTRVSRLLQELEFSGFIQRTTVPPSLREELFDPSERVNLLALALTESGVDKIEDFKKAIRRHFGNWLSKASKDQPWAVRWLGRLIVPRAIGLYQSIISRIAETE